MTPIVQRTSAIINNMKTALISVYNKEGIVEFAKEILDIGYKILASGGTAKALSEAGIEVTDVASLVGGGAILGHRVVTLSREVHAGLLAKDNEEDRKELAELKIPFIDLVCCDLYPLADEIAKTDSTLESVIEKTDIGGPTMLRSAAKGRRVVICDPADRTRVVEWLKGGEQDKEEFISGLVAKAEYIVADYVLASARYHSAGKLDGLVGEQILEAKYGENGWQTPAGLFKSGHADILSLNNFKVLAGTAPSYNNLADVDRLLQTIIHIAAGFEVNFKAVPKIAVGVKHGNPCGAAVNDNPHTVLQKMLEGDLRAIFGGVVMVNFTIDEVAAEILLSYQMPAGQRRLLDGIIAPDFAPAAVEMLKRKGDKCRFLVNSGLASLTQESLDKHPRFRYVRGGFLKQPNYSFVLNFQDKAIEKTGEADDGAQKDLLLAWAVGSTSNSNTVTLVKDGQLIGNGVGQQDRVSCCQLAIKRATDANHEVKGAVAYSDSFFPFVDGVETLSSAGIKSIFATSGSVRDPEVKKFCADNGISLIMMPDSQARGFFGH
jgi:phosphoribosylaminoimidazolecarboxamide formyltransferase/IMP cyclohydrolase